MWVDVAEKALFHYSNHFSVKQENFLQPKEYPIAPLPRARIWPLLIYQHHLLALHRAFLLKLLNIVILSLNLSVFLQILKTAFATELVQSTCILFNDPSFHLQMLCRKRKHPCSKPGTPVNLSSQFNPSHWCSCMNPFLYHIWETLNSRKHG